MITGHYYTVSSSFYIIYHRVANQIHKRPHFQVYVMILVLRMHFLEMKVVGLFDIKECILRPELKLQKRLFKTLHPYIIVPFLNTTVLTNAK